MLKKLISFGEAGLPALATFLATLVVLWFINSQKRVHANIRGSRYGNQIISLFVGILGLISVILVLPVNDNLRGQLLTLLGLLLTAIITLSSTTVAANAMAGFMLHTLKKFRPGDFICVGEHFGRVTEQDLFHTEIQTEDRDLTTLPNTYLVNNPYKVVHASGTIVSASVSLGYDVDQRFIEKLLKEAALESGLEEPFVYVTELADFSAHYRVCGFLKEVKQLISVRSELRRKMLDHLHSGGIEIVSPNFMNQRVLEKNKFIPPVRSHEHEESDRLPEETVFDKAEKAQQIELLKDTYAELKQEVAALDEKLSNTKDESREQLAKEVERKTRRLQAIKKVIGNVSPNKKA